VTFNEAAHPRGRGEHGGEWVKKLDSKIAKDLGEISAVKPKIKNAEVRNVRKWNAGIMTSLWSRPTKVERKEIHDVIAAQFREPINIRASEAAIEAIIRQRRFKNIHEHPVSERRRDYLKTRKDYEDQVMGLDGVPAKQRPAYGYVGGVNEVTSYGAYAMTLKSRVRKRTTVSTGDSLNGMLDTHPIDDVPNLDFPAIKGMTHNDNALPLRHQGELYGGTSSWRHQDQRYQVDYSSV